MGDYVTDDVRVLLDDACMKALKAGTPKDVFMRVVAERWFTFEGLPIDWATQPDDPGASERGETE